MIMNEELVEKIEVGIPGFDLISEGGIPYP